MSPIDYSKLRGLRWKASHRYVSSPLRYFPHQDVEAYLGRRSRLDGKRSETAETFEVVRILVQGFDGREHASEARKLTSYLLFTRGAGNVIERDTKEVSL
jgi:hypothetical protein